MSLYSFLCSYCEEEHFLLVYRDFTSDGLKVNAADRFRCYVREEGGRGPVGGRVVR